MNAFLFMTSNAATAILPAPLTCPPCSRTNGLAGRPLARLKGFFRGVLSFLGGILAMQGGETSGCFQLRYMMGWEYRSISAMGKAVLMSFYIILKAIESNINVVFHMFRPSCNTYARCYRPVYQGKT